ncbi:hypothetical protein BCV69DRAFT_147297 [Microstroma glucosiphilum]|uniref:Uncharacterized protein n=1 Tax=Pseudomicrostroma glucosiphilum TaxID=1684307 RepID=A0A316UF79_9BASI|nr:hypothetical protein BCV69DRAFT_147297 [Pseudomicrostroma glucosiphilum]PWN22553.1 hypothetical protein BCV69DRAFT_147297 [Pseudomicrostroma glucosiphilum]
MMIVAAAVGGPASTPNRILTHVELFATCESDERDEDEVQEDNADRRGKSGSNGRTRRTLSIARGYRAAREAAAEGATGPTVSFVAGDLLSPRSAMKAQADLSEDHRGSSSQTEYEPDDRRSYAHITAENWRRKLGAHLWKNTGQRSSVIHAAQQIIGRARILGCKSTSIGPSAQSSDTGSTASPLALERLPPELRLAILRQLDADRVLSEEQFRLIVSWACDSSTIGYGGEGVPLPWAQHADAGGSSSSQWATSTNRAVGLLPAAPWDWQDMLSRSLPRDWVAESWDLWNEHKDTIPIIGGGGGPDGEGGATEPVTRGGGRSGGSIATGSLDRRAPDPALLAFLEATGTRARQD